MARKHKIDKNMLECETCKILDYTHCPLHDCMERVNGIICPPVEKCMVKNTMDRIFEMMKHDASKSVRSEYKRNWKKIDYDAVVICKA